MWYITGDETYRSNAMYIIRAYAGIQSVATHTSFRFATMTYLLAAAAEILRYSDTPTGSLKWNETDTQNFINMMELCSVTYKTAHIQDMPAFKNMVLPALVDLALSLASTTPIRLPFLPIAR